MARLADHSLFNKRPPNQPTLALPPCRASELLESAAYHEAAFAYNAN